MGVVGLRFAFVGDALSGADFVDAFLGFACLYWVLSFQQQFLCPPVLQHMLVDCRAVGL